jgi:hypothetical protein
MDIAPSLLTQGGGPEVAAAAIANAAAVAVFEGAVAAATVSAAAGTAATALTSVLTNATTAATAITSAAKAGADTMILRTAKHVTDIEARIRREFTSPLMADVPVMTRRIMELMTVFIDPATQRSVDAIQDVITQTLQRVVGPDGAVVGVACAGALLHASAPASSAWRGVKPAPLQFPLTINSTTGRINVEEVVEGAAGAVLTQFPPARDTSAATLEAVMEATARLVATAELFAGTMGAEKALFVRKTLQAVVQKSPGWASDSTLSLAYLLIDELSDAYKNKVVALQSLAMQATGALLATAATTKCFGLCK